MEEQKGFYSSLFDFSSSSFITTRIIKYPYQLAILLAFISAAYFLVSGFMSGFTSGIIQLILAPLCFLFCVIRTRAGLEPIIVIFRIAEDTHAMAKSNLTKE